MPKKIYQSDSMRTSLHGLSAGGEGQNEKSTKKSIEEYFRDELTKDGYDLNCLAANYERLSAAIELETLTHEKANAPLPAKGKREAEKLNLANADALYQLLNAIYYEVTAKVRIKINELPPAPEFRRPKKKLKRVPQISESQVWVIPIIVGFLAGFVANRLFIYWKGGNPLSGENTVGHDGVVFFGVFLFVGWVCFSVLVDTKKEYDAEYGRILYEAKAKHEARYKSWLALKEEIELRQKAQKTRDELNKVLHG